MAGRSNETPLDPSRDGLETPRFLLIAAPSSGSGKTTVTLALLRAMKQRGYLVAGYKAGPDFIDPGFHAIASGQACGNLDPWGMQSARLESALGTGGRSHCLIEAMMGLFDGAANGSGSAAELAKLGSVPVILVVDAAKQSHSVAALVRGFRDHDPSVNVAGVILNKVGSPRHEDMLRSALSDIGVPVFGAIPRSETIVVPERHLGLVQARENATINAFIDNAADLVGAHCDVDGIADLFSHGSARPKPWKRLSSPGDLVAIARDDAFSFCYPHILSDWKTEAQNISFFSPLANEVPSTDATAIYLPGGYPELHAERLSSAHNFISALRNARERGVLVYGECGGYMVLGKGLTDSDGKRHTMAGLLDLETSFKARKLHLGYRSLRSRDFFMGDTLTAHEFHYTSALVENGEPLFEAKDALGTDLGSAGLRDRNVMGSYMHVIDRSDA